MRIGASLVLIAIGAILKFAITTHNTSGFNLGTAGIILMIVGAVGLVITLVMMTTRRRTDIVDRTPVGTRSTTYRTPNDPADPGY
jgi:membrane-bound ClpP family serine protease